MRLCLPTWLVVSAAHPLLSRYSVAVQERDIVGACRRSSVRNQCFAASHADIGTSISVQQTRRAAVTITYHHPFLFRPDVCGEAFGGLCFPAYDFDVRMSRDQ